MKKNNRWLYDILIVVGIVMVGYAGVKLYGHYADRAMSDSLYEELNEQYVSKAEQSSAPAEESATLP